jgi:DNA polymerase-3 subunit epsilon
VRFVAIDVETANANMTSICAVGAATFEDGKLSAEWYSLVDPDDYFDPVNVSIHGIDESMVSGAPVYRDVSGTIDRLLDDATGRDAYAFRSGGDVPDRAALGRQAASLHLA